MTLAELNRMNRGQFVGALRGIVEHSPWVGEGAFAGHPFGSADALHAAMMRVVADAGEARQLALIRAHPKLAGTAAMRHALTTDSASEQSGAGLDRCSPAEFARLAELNARYEARFGFPFILAVKGYDRAGIIAELARRIENDRETEFAECLRQIARISRLRLASLLDARES